MTRTTNKFRVSRFCAAKLQVVPWPTATFVCSAILNKPSYRGAWLVFIFALSGRSISHAVRLENGQRIGLAQMVAELGDAPLVIIGELHDHASHHELQLAVIKGLQQTDQALAMGLEMFQIPDHAALDNRVAGKTDEAQFIKLYPANWRNLNGSLYLDILLLARDQRIRMVALNAPQALEQSVALGGFAALSASDLRALPPETTDVLSIEGFSAMASYYPPHGKNPHALRHLMDAQVLRNRGMAKGIEHYLARHPQTQMVVLTGGLHAWRKGGIPSELGKLAYKVVLPPMPGMDLIDPAAVGADFLMV